jgi:hypothetical protein
VEPGLLDVDTSGVMEKKIINVICTALNSGNNYKINFGCLCTKQHRKFFSLRAGLPIVQVPPGQWQ